ncbi:MAG: hypothetical protein NVSMB10_15010 [Steroidobacteraceae bacterium]
MVGLKRPMDSRSGVYGPRHAGQGLPQMNKEEDFPMFFSRTVPRHALFLVPYLAVFPPTADAVHSGAAPTFGQPTISGIQGVGYEQDLRLDPTDANRVYTSVPGSLSSDTSWIWHSEDGGKTFKWVVAGTAKEGKPNSCAGGGDTELAVDAGGNLYFNDLTLANFSTARSADHGATFLCSNTGVPDTAVDRQWYATDGDPTEGGSIYLSNDEIGPGSVTCQVSGNVNNVLAMYRSPLPPAAATAGIQFGPGYKVTPINSCDEGIMGNDEVSPVATTTGQPLAGGGFAILPKAVKHIYVIHDDATFSKIAIGRCFPVAFGAPLPNTSDPSGLNCVNLPVADLGAPGTVKTGGNFPAMAIDKAGNLYAVWEQAAVDPSGKIGNTSLKYAFSTNEGNTWSAPMTIPTPGLLNDVFAWPAAGDSGRVDVAFYGTSAAVDTTTGGPNKCLNGGPDSVNGVWSLYVVQTLNGRSASPSFTPPILASEHPIHKGDIQTVIGGQCGDRTLGDFLQIRVGSSGEAQISYADSNNQDAGFAPHGMYVKQNGGTGLFVNRTVASHPILLNSASDPAGDAKRETDGVSSANIANLDILQSSFAEPKPAHCHPAGTPCYRITMLIDNLSLTPPAPDTDAVWLTQWLVPADPGCTSSAPSCKNGGKNPFVYFESNAAATSCWSGENAAQVLGGGITLTYPGMKQITAPGACSFVPGKFGKISIDVPISDVSLDAGVLPVSKRLFSVTASTMTLAAPAESAPPNPGRVGLLTAPIGGVLFDLIDVVRAYDFLPRAGGGGEGEGCHERDGHGDIHGAKSGEASFHFDDDPCEGDHTEEVAARDSDRNMSFHSTKILSVAVDDVAHSLSMSGLGTDNGVPVAFTIVAVDSAAAPPGLFSISLSDGYTNSGNLTTGSITLH